MKQALGVLGLFFFAQVSHAALPSSCSLFDDSTVSTGRPLPLGQYQVQLQTCTAASETWVGLRSFQSQRRSYTLLVHPETLETRIAATECLRCSPTAFEQLPSSRYKQTLQRQASSPVPLMNGGLTHARNQQGLFLSMDLCPSHKDFDASVFQASKIQGRTQFPMAVSLSGGWMSRHPSEFQWLKGEVLNRHLDIVWVNHSYTHPYRKGVENSRNFLLAAPGNFDNEVLRQEQYMISNGVTPSIFFRFPGLVSDTSLTSRLTEFGLVSLGSDAWLALGQKPKPGSIILIHGNGNEENGVRLFLNFLESVKNMDVFKAMTLAP